MEIVDHFNEAECQSCDGGQDCYYSSIKYLGDAKAKATCKKCECATCSRGKCPAALSNKGER